MEQEISKEMIGFYGLIGGAVLTLIGTIISQGLSVLKDYYLAKSSRQDKEAERAHQAESRERVETTIIFQNSLSSLGEFINKAQNMPNKDASYFKEEISAIQASMSQLTVKFINSDLERDLIAFISFPATNGAVRLREKILKILKTNTDLASTVVLQKERPVYEGYNFTVNISSEYTREHFKNTGVILDNTITFKYDPKSTSETVREAITEMYFVNGRFNLETRQPLYIPIGADVQKSRVHWSADFDPNEKGANFTLEEWAKCFLEQKKKYSSTQNGQS